MRVAVAGGTGWVGRLLVEVLRARGDDPVVLARSTGVDLTVGGGLGTLLEGVDAVIDVTNIGTLRAKPATAFFDAVTRNLLDAEYDAGVRHHVDLSIIGVDRVGMGYYRGKRHQEELVLGGRVPGTVLRATQFHEFAAQMLAGHAPIVFVPRMLSQPVAAAEVARHLAELAHGEPLGLAPELAGPEQMPMPEMVRSVARLRGDHRPVVTMPLPGEVGRQVAAGALLPSAPGPRGTTTFAEWLATQRTP